MNVRGGGIGQNKELDLTMENSIGNRKVLIKHLGANKTENAIIRATGAADAVSAVVNNVASDLNMRKSSGRHTKVSTETDISFVCDSLREIRPFRLQPGRLCRGFSKLGSNPFANVDTERMKDSIMNKVTRLARAHIKQ